MKRTVKHGLVEVFPSASEQAREILDALESSPEGVEWMVAVLREQGWLVEPPSERTTDAVTQT